MYHIFISHSFVGGHLDYFHFLIITTRAAMHIAGQVSMESNVESFTHMPQSGITWSHMVDLFLDF